MIKVKFILMSILLIIAFNIFYNNSRFKLTQQERFQFNGKSNTLGVDMVYAITMPNRKEYITAQINKLDTGCMFFNAVTPDDLTKEDYDNLSTTYKENTRISGLVTRLPLTISFLCCFKNAIDNNYDTIIVFEDDIKINQDINTIKEGISEFKKSNFDIFYMGYCFLNCETPIGKVGNLIEIKSKDLLCAHALCIKTKILKNLIDFVLPMDQNFDEILRNFYSKYNIKVCVPKITYFDQEDRAIMGTLNESYEVLKTCVF
jgi:GR25 family glycosyltransferase involved in LPS biosynthesis